MGMPIGGCGMHGGSWPVSQYTAATDTTTATEVAGESGEAAAPAAKYDEGAYPGQFGAGFRRPGGPRPDIDPATMAARLIQRLDTDQSGAIDIATEAASGRAARIAGADGDGDGKVTADELTAAIQARHAAKSTATADVSTSTDEVAASTEATETAVAGESGEAAETEATGTSPQQGWASGHRGMFPGGKFGGSFGNPTQVGGAQGGWPGQHAGQGRPHHAHQFGGAIAGARPFGAEAFFDRLAARADANGDGMLSRDEFLAAHGKSDVTSTSNTTSTSTDTSTGAAADTSTDTTTAVSTDSTADTATAVSTDETAGETAPPAAGSDGGTDEAPVAPVTDGTDGGTVA